MPPSETLSREAIAAGEVAKPPFAMLPDPRLRFKAHAARFARLAPGHHLEGYLRFLATLSQIQHDCQDGLGPVQLPEQDVLAAAYAHGMPVIPATTFIPDEAATEAFMRIAGTLRAGNGPAEAQAAAQSVVLMPREARATIMERALGGDVPPGEIAVHGLAAAALQVHFTRLASLLDAARLTAVAPGACPSCGSPPVASLIVAWPKLQGHRYCCCSLCGTRWNVSRITCLACGSDKSVAYHGIEGGSEAVKAETCGECHGYVKILNQQKEADLDPVADDVASLGLDLLLREEGFHRAAANPFLLGY